MPVVRIFAVGGASAVSPPCNLRRRVVLVADAAFNTSPLLVEGLPHLFLWGMQTFGGVAATMLWQWSARSATGVPAGTGPVDDWQPLFPAATTFLVVGGATPVYYERAAFSAKRIRLQLTRPAGQATTVEVFYGGTL